MSSSLNSSALARAAAEQASAKFDAQSFLLRKSDTDSGSNDVFAKIFASAQEAQKPRPAAELKTEDSTPEQDIPADRTPHSRGTAKTKSTSPSTDDTREARQGDEAAAAQPKQTAKTEKKSGKHECKAKDDQKSDQDAKTVADAASAAPVKAEATDDTEVAAETAQVAVDQTPDTKDAAAAAAAFCLPAVLKAQEVTAAGTLGDEDGSQEQVGTPGKAALADLTTFRANPAAGVKKAGKDLAAAVAGAVANGDTAIGAGAKADAGVKTDAKADIKTGFETEIKKPESKAADVTAMFQPQVASQAKDDAVAEFTANVQGGISKKSAGDASSAATPEKIEANDAAADAPVSQTPPAAGSRANALSGFPAPTPTGSGSGSPFAKAAGNGVETAPGLGTISTSARIDGGGVIQLAKVVKTDGAMMTSPAEQVAVSLTRMVKNGGSSFEVQLNPAELGKVEIKLDISKDGAVNAVVTSDNPKTHDMLQKDAGTLAKVFQDAGLQADSGSLSFNLRSDAQQQQAANQGDQPAWKRWNNNQSAEVAVTAQPEFYTTAPGRVDMMI